MKDKYHAGSTKWGKYKKKEQEAKKRRANQKKTTGSSALLGSNKSSECDSVSVSALDDLSSYDGSVSQGGVDSLS